MSGTSPRLNISIRPGWAAPNPKHLEVLRRLAQEAGTSLALLNQGMGLMEQTLDVGGDGQRQAFLPQAEKVVVYMTECISPDLFYVTRVRDVKSLQELERELCAWAASQGYPIFSFNPSVGQVVMVQPGNGEEEGWQRARVINKLGHQQVGGAGDLAPRVEERLRVFCLDSGETFEVRGSRVGACPPSIATKIPFQAVKCSLASWTDWKKCAGDELFEMTRNKDTDEPIPLWCKVIGKEGESYRIRLWDDRVEGVVDLGECLGKLGLASRDEMDEVEDNSLEDGWDVSDGLPDDVFPKHHVIAATQAAGQKILSREVEDNEVLIAPTVQQHSPPCRSTHMTPAPLILPSSLPHLKIVKSCINYKSRVPGILWSQNSNNILLTLDVAAMVNLILDQVHLSLKGKELQIEVVQVEEGTVSLHSTGMLTLWGKVNPRGTTVQVKGPKVHVTLTKANACSWQRLVEQKFGWIQQDKSKLVECNPEGEEEQDMLRNTKLERGFLEPFLVSSGGESTPCYHPITGETVMPEQVGF